MISIVIPTYRREHILLQTIQLIHSLQCCLSTPSELLIIDQTEDYSIETLSSLNSLHSQGKIRWHRLIKPHLTKAMNTGLLHARGSIVLFLDDDIIPSTSLLTAHLNAHHQYSEAWAVVGQVLQPGQTACDLPQHPHASSFWRDLDFPFNTSRRSWIANAMAGNLSVKRTLAIKIGGFDENFPPPVASRFETEFAKRLIRHGGNILFEPEASIQHLAIRSGGTRSRGSHLTSASGRYGVGDYYFALRSASDFDKLWYLIRKPFREVRTRFHLFHPWWIPLKLIGEYSGFIWALQLSRRSPQLISHQDIHSVLLESR
jgi:GT2 family glycosyltransferase